MEQCDGELSDELDGRLISEAQVELQTATGELERDPAIAEEARHTEVSIDELEWETVV